MPPPPVLGEFSRRLRARPVATVRFIVTRLVDDPVWVLHRALAVAGRAPLPPGLLDRLFELAVRGRLGSLGTLLTTAAVVRSGGDERLERIVGAVASRSRPRERRLLGGLAVELERPELVAGLVTGDAARDRLVRARADARLGERERAAHELAGVGGRVGARARARLAGDRAALEPGWVPVPGWVGPPPAPRPERVVHLLNNSLPHKQTGYTVRTHRVLLAQRDVGLDPVAVTRPGFPWNEGRFDAVAAHRIDEIPYVHVADDAAPAVGEAARLARDADHLVRTVADLAPALLHPTSPHRNAQVALGLRERLGVPVLYELRGFLEDTWLSRRPPGAESSDHYLQTRAVEAWCAEQADHVVTLGAAMRDDLVARGVPAERVSVVPNAVDAARFAPTGRGGAAVRRELGLEGRTVVGYITSLQPYEGVGTLVEATRLLRDRGEDVALLVVGDGPERTRLVALADQLGLTEHVRFPGRVPHEHIVEHYEAIDVFVVPRRDQRVCRMVTPLKPVEAMALERAVVVSALPALEELIEPGRTGLTFRAEDPTALADVVGPLLGDPARRATLGAAARQQVLEQRTWEANGARYRRIADSLLAR